uniref:GRIP and coiled-coil domain containing 2 n=1 Tax=Oncorhynchus kisutch TaxID=8019 RepID=A0A8C7C5Y0_ONCKI
MARMLELSGLSLIDASDGETQSRQLRSALEDQQSQNTMLQEELTFLGNVKTELEAELERVREEFHTENEELQFKIEELLMTREVATPNRDLLSLETPNRDLQEAQAFTQLQQSGPQRDSVDGLPASPASPSSPRQSLSCPVPGATHQSLTLQEQQGQAQELRSQCESLDRSQAVAEYEHTRDILRGLETEQGQRTGDVTRQYEAMKEQAASAVQELQESIRRLTEERDGLVERVKGLNEDRDSLLEKVQGLEKRLESFLKQTQAAERLKEQLQTSMEEKTALALKLKNSVEAQTVLASELKASLEVQTVLAVELRASVEDLSKQNGEILSQLQMRESAVQELEETVNVVSTERDRTLSALQDREMEVMRLWEERAREVEESQGQREEVAELQARIEELEKERSLLKSNLELVQRESCKNVQGSPGEEVEELQARIEELEKERSLLKSNLGEVVGDTEALQKDLREMKLANEKMRTENQELLTQVSQATETLADREREEKEGREEEEEQAEKERRELQQQLTEKDTVISQLRSEMAALLEKERKEKDERMNKIKAVAVKARKELDTSRKEAVSLKEEVEVLKAERERVTSSMKDIIHGAEGYKNLQLDYDRQTEQLDKERETVEGAEKQISELTKRLNNAVQQHEQLWSEREDLMTELETLRNTVRQMEGQTAELHRQTDTLNRDLQAEELLKEQKTKELSSLQKDMEELTVQLRRQKQQSQQTTQELEQLRKEAQQSSLLDMEMADYERLVKELNTKLSEKDVCVEELKTQIHTHTQKEDTLNQEIEVLKSQLDQGEDKSSKMKQLLVKTKKDLADAKRQVRPKGPGYLDYREVCLAFNYVKHELMCDVNVISKAELSSVTAEFDSYKVRVHNVLKQQKNKTSAQSDGDATKQEREQMESLVDQYKAKLQDSQQSLAVSTAELQQLQMEHDTLLERHNKILQETVAKEAELRERFMSLQAEIMSLRTEHAQTVGQLTSQAVAQRSGFREQIRHLQDEHRTTVETLQNQMTRLENQLFTLQKQTSPAPVQTSRKSAVDRRPVDQGGTGGLGLGDLQSMAREEGEGMETSETESLSSTYLPSLEQLLTSPDPKQEPFVWQVEPTKEELNQKLTTATRSMEHMNSLLHETEATNAVLNEQVNLLKSEVRRLERNHEREKSVANLEYLKNVLLQFIFLQSGSERQALLPVIHTMLQLSPEEKNKLAAIAMGRYTHTVNKHTYIYTHTHCKQTHIYIYKHTL